MTQPLQVSGYTPTRDAHLIDVNLVGDQAPICPHCTRGRVHLTGQHDWRGVIMGYCDNPECGDPDDPHKGRHLFVRLFPDGAFNRFVPDGEVTPHVMEAARSAGKLTKLAPVVSQMTSGGPKPAEPAAS